MDPTAQPALRDGLDVGGAIAPRRHAWAVEHRIQDAHGLPQVDSVLIRPVQRRGKAVPVVPDQVPDDLMPTDDGEAALRTHAE